MPVLPTFANQATALPALGMTSLLISFILWLFKQGAPNQIAERNRLKLDAERAFISRDYALAATFYRRLTESALIPEPMVLFNQAQAHFVLNDTLRARALYSRLTRVSDLNMAASALVQLGVLACRTGDSTQAIAYFERALRILPSHQPARYNFELLRKIQSPAGTSRRHPLAQKAGTPQPETPRPQPSSSARALPTDKREDVLKKLERYELTEQKARMLLDAMRTEEIQYIQQRRRNGPAGEANLKQTW